MNPEMWKRVKHVVDPILEHDRRSWPVLLAESCGEDFDVFLQAVSLLEASQRVGNFIEHPAFDIHHPRTKGQRRPF